MIFSFGSAHELLATVDVVGRACKRGVGHDVNGERGDVGWADDAAEGERRAQFLPPGLKPVSEQRCRQRGVNEAGSDEIDACWCELEGERRGERGQRGRGRGQDAEATADAPAAGCDQDVVDRVWQAVEEALQRG